MPDDEKKPDQKEPTESPSNIDPVPGTPGSASISSSSGGAPDENDRFRPDAIAARVERIGEETELDRIAHEEEQKLLARKKEQRKAKRGLEAAASKRLAKIGEGTVKRPTAAADAYVPEADPLLERVRKARKWIEGHRQVFGAAVAAAVVVVGGLMGWSYWQTKHEADASALLASAFADEHGHISDKDDDDDNTSTHQLYPTFKSASDRRQAALAKYRQVESKYAGTGAAILARLAEGGLLLDEGDAKGAIAAYEEVKASPLGSADAEVRGRALEGAGFGHELLAESEPQAKDKHLDDALAAFKALEGVDLKGFKELGMYHQARVLQAKDDRAKAVEMLKEVHKRVTEPGESHPFSYLEFVVEDRLRALDPSALPPKAPHKSGAPGDFDMNDPQIQKLIRQLQEQGKMGGPPAPPLPKESP